MCAFASGFDPVSIGPVFLSTLPFNGVQRLKKYKNYFELYIFNKHKEFQENYLSNNT